MPKAGAAAPDALMGGTAVTVPLLGAPHRRDAAVDRLVVCAPSSGPTEDEAWPSRTLHQRIRMVS
ncbi:MAG: hypothetical protein QOE41_3417 [Mycobacterium sp.]|nr:hypothetical protein [Mycobacterium sp.]